MAGCDIQLIRNHVETDSFELFFCKLRAALGFHITPTTEQPKGRYVWAPGRRSWALGTSFAEKTARRNVAPERWVFLAGTGGGVACPPPPPKGGVGHNETCSGKGDPEEIEETGALAIRRCWGKGYHPPCLVEAPPPPPGWLNLFGTKINMVPSATQYNAECLQLVGCGQLVCASVSCLNMSVCPLGLRTHGSMNRTQEPTGLAAPQQQPAPPPGNGM